MKQVADKLEAIEEVLQQLVINVTELKKHEAAKPAITFPDYTKEFENTRKLFEARYEIILSNHLNLIADKVNELAGKKAEIKQFRFLLFPETNQGTYYKIVFGRLIPWGIFFLVLAGGFSLGRIALQNQQIKAYNAQAQKYVNAWDYLEAHTKDKLAKKKMINAWAKANP